MAPTVWNIICGCFLGYFLIYRPIVKKAIAKGDFKKSRIGIILASIIGCVVTLQLGAFSVVLETSVSGITEIPFLPFMGLMQPIHLAIGLIEGVITAAVLVFIYESRPEMIIEGLDAVNKGSATRTKTYSKKFVIVTIAVATLIIGGGLSLLASSNPDGLEWSLFGNEEGGYAANMGLDEEDYGIASTFSDTASQIVDATAFMPDYAFKSNPDNFVGTQTAGVVGAVMVAVLAGIICMAGGMYRVKQTEKK